MVAEKRALLFSFLFFSFLFFYFILYYFLSFSFLFFLFAGAQKLELCFSQCWSQLLIVLSFCFGCLVLSQLIC